MEFSKHNEIGIHRHAFVLVSVFLSACGGEDAPVVPPAVGVTFQPAGCAFSIAPRAEYTGVAVQSTQTSATPNIRRVRLGLGGSIAHDAPGRADPSTSMAFGWQTDDGTQASEVIWGSSPDSASWPAQNRTNGISWLVPPGDINPQGEARMHEAYVCGLTPNTTYYYRVGGGPAGQEVWSDVYTFKTTPSDPNSSVRIAFTGDSRGQDNNAWQLIQRRVLAIGADLQLFSGDTINFATDQGEWDQWVDAAWKDSDGSLLTLGQILTLPAHGNHENHTPLFYGNFVLPQDMQNFPKFGELFFSIDVGPVHLVVMDDLWIGFADYEPDFKAQFEPWLREDLKRANDNRANVPWIVTVHHHSEYSSSNHGGDAEVLRVREFFGPINDEFHVDLVIAGHDHNYERSKPVNTATDGTPTVKPSFSEGTVYIVCAGAGADSYSAGTSVFTELSRDYKTGGAIGFYGFLAATKTTLAVEAHELRVDATDPVFDTLTITK